MLASFSDGNKNKAYRNYIPAAQVFGHLRVRPSLLDPRKRIPHKKLIASGTSRFDKDIYCKTQTKTHLVKSLNRATVRDDRVCAIKRR